MFIREQFHNKCPRSQSLRLKSAISWNDNVLSLTFLNQNKTATYLQITFWNAFSWIKMIIFQSKCHCSLFWMVQLIISHHWFRWWFSTKQVSLPEPMMTQFFDVYMCITRPQWADEELWHLAAILLKMLKISITKSIVLHKTVFCSLALSHQSSVCNTY